MQLLLFILFGCSNFAAGVFWLLMRLSLIRKHPSMGCIPRTWSETFQTVSEATPSHRRGFYLFLMLSLSIWAVFMLFLT